jgi:hypothetical protein
MQYAHLEQDPAPACSVVISSASASASAVPMETAFVSFIRCVVANADWNDRLISQRCSVGKCTPGAKQYRANIRDNDAVIYQVLGSARLKLFAAARTPKIMPSMCPHLFPPTNFSAAHVRSHLLFFSLLYHQ